MRTRWRSSRAAVKLRGTVPAPFCVRPSSLHWFHTRITVVATCPVRAAMSRYKKPAPFECTHLLILRPFASTRHTCTSFHVSTLFGNSALTEQGITLTLLVTQEMSLLGLCVRHLSGNVINRAQIFMQMHVLYKLVTLLILCTREVWVILFIIIE